MSELTWPFESPHSAVIACLDPSGIWRSDGDSLTDLIFTTSSATRLLMTLPSRVWAHISVRPGANVVTTFRSSSTHATLVSSEIHL